MSVAGGFGRTMSVAGGWGLDEQFPMGVDEQDLVVPLDEQDPHRSNRLGMDE